MAGARRLDGAPRPTARGAGVSMVVVGLVTLALATGTVELSALVVAVGLPLLVAPFVAVRRGRRARARVSINAGASPAMSVVGGAVTMRIEATRRRAGSVPPLAVVRPETQWRRRQTDTTEPPSRAWIVPSRLVTLGTGSGGVLESAVPSRRRGVFVLPLEHSWVLDGFGLFGVRGPVIPTASVVFFPGADFEGEWEHGNGGPRAMESTSVIGGLGRDGPGDLVGIRPYVAGDRLSLLHWPARARYGSWFVRQFAAESEAQTRLVIDDRAGMHRRKDFERMLERTHGLVERCFEEGRSVELCTMSGRSATLAPVEAGLEEALLMLATVLPGAMMRRVPLDGTVVTTTTGAASLPEEVERIVVQ